MNFYSRTLQTAIAIKWSKVPFYSNKSKYVESQASEKPPPLRTFAKQIENVEQLSLFAPFC